MKINIIPKIIRSSPAISAKNDLYGLKKLPAAPAIIPKRMNAIVIPLEKTTVINNALFRSLKRYEKNVGMITKPQGEVNVSNPPINAIRKVTESATCCWYCKTFCIPRGRSSAETELTAINISNKSV